MADAGLHEAHQNALSFAETYRDCVEALCLIHSGKKDWHRPHRALLVKVGIEQARLLAWSQIMGVCELGQYRDPRLDVPETQKKLRTIVKDMLDRLVHADESAILAKYGLKPSTRPYQQLEVALDSTRLESLREQYMLLPKSIYASWNKSTHWTIQDNAKFDTFVLDTRESIDQLVKLMDVSARVDECIKHDIRAMGWHPVFDRDRAALDGSKLRLIQDACAQDYPQYAEATRIPIAYLATQWSDSYQEMMHHKYPLSTAYGLKAMHIHGAHKNESPTTDAAGRKQSLAGIFSKLRSHSWHREIDTAAHTDTPRSNSLAPPSPSNPAHALDPVRSRSEGAAVHHPGVHFNNPFSHKSTHKTSAAT